MSTPIEVLIKETKADFVIAKSDGVLDASEVIKIAVALSQKVQKLANLSGSEKKSLLLMTLKKGLDTSGGVGSLPGFASASEELKAAFEDNLLNAASSAIDAIILAASGKLDLRKPSSWLACLPACLSAVNVAIPKDQLQLREAVDFADKLLHKHTDPSSPIKDAVVKVVTSDVVSVSEVVTAALPGAVADDKK